LEQVDAGLALDLALIRSESDRPEPLEQLALAFSVVGNQRPNFRVGKVTESGDVESADVSEAAYDAGLITGFALGGRRYGIKRGAAGAESLTVDGKQPVVHELPSFRLRFTAAESWTAPGGLEVERLFGRPAATTVDDGRFVLKGSRTGFDAVAIGPGGPPSKLSARIVPHGAGGGLLVGAADGKTSYVGVALLVSAEPRRAQLIAVDGKAKAWQLAEPVALGDPPAEGYALTLSLVDDKVVATVDKHRLEGKAPDFASQGRSGLVVGSDARIDVRNLAGAKGGKAK
jgi:hypothetical protein